MYPVAGADSATVPDRVLCSMMTAALACTAYFASALHVPQDHKMEHKMQRATEDDVLSSLRKTCGGACVEARPCMLSKHLLASYLGKHLSVSMLLA